MIDYSFTPKSAYKKWSKYNVLVNLPQGWNHLNAQWVTRKLREKWRHDHTGIHWSLFNFHKGDNLTKMTRSKNYDE